MKFNILLLLALTTTTTLLSSSIFEKKYEGCAQTRQEALYSLSGNILSRVSTSMTQKVEVDNEVVKSKVSSYTSTATNLSLSDITYVDKKDEVCAVVYKNDQVKNTKKLLKQALLYKSENLPKDTDEKIKKLSKWIENIEQLSYLIPVFLVDVESDQEILNKKEKLFKDLYSKNVAYSDSLFFKSCKSTQEKAKLALNDELFKDKTVQKEKSFFDTLGSMFSSENSTEMLEVFDEQLIYAKKDSSECVMLKKEDLLEISKRMYANISRVNEKSLSKDPKVRYKEIDNLYQQLAVTKALFRLYPDIYKTKDFERLNEVKRFLKRVQEKTNPQFIVFHISGAEDIKILLDGIIIKNNEKKYIKDGDHTYKIQGNGKCPLVTTFSNDKFEDIVISKDLEGYEYPTVVFQTDKEPSIVVNGQVIKPNIVTTINECKDESHYIVKYSQQNRTGEIDTSPGSKETVVLNFLTATELAIFNDAKTKRFTVSSGIMFSESLTSVNSDNLEFSVLRKTTNGTLTLHESGSFKYISDLGFTGIDSFEYEIEIPGKDSAPKLVNINVVASPLTTVTTKKKEVEKPKIEKKEEKTKEENIVLVKKQEVEKKAPSVSYEEFKLYVSSKQLTVEFMKKIQKKFPDYFERLRKEMTH